MSERVDTKLIRKLCSDSLDSVYVNWTVADLLDYIEALEKDYDNYACRIQDTSLKPIMEVHKKTIETLQKTCEALDLGIENAHRKNGDARYEHGLQYPMTTLLMYASERLGMPIDQMAYKKCFSRPIFMGNGGDTAGEDGTSQKMAILYHKVDRALSILGGAQQNGLQGHRFDEQSDKDDDAALDEIVRDIAMALTGKEIRFIEE